MVKVDPIDSDEIAKRLAQIFNPDLSHERASFREMADNDEAERARQDRHERIAVEVDREGLRQHDDAEPDDGGRAVLPRPAAEPAPSNASLSLDAQLICAPPQR